MRGIRAFDIGMGSAGLLLAVVALTGPGPSAVTVALYVAAGVCVVVALFDLLGWGPFSDKRSDKRNGSKAKPVLRALHTEGRAMIPEDPGLRGAHEFSRSVENWEARVVATFDKWGLHRAAERFGPPERPHGDSHAAGYELRRRLEILEDIINDLAD